MKLFPRKRKKQIELDEIFMDSSNLPSFNQGRLEGRLALPLSERSILGVGVVFVLIVIIFFGQAFKLQVVEGKAFAERSENNRLDTSLLIAPRGVIYDSRDERLAWNLDDPFVGAATRTKGELAGGRRGDVHANDGEITVFEFEDVGAALAR